MNNLSDNTIINKNVERDSISDSMAKGFGYYCDLLSRFKAKGVIEKGEYILTPSLNKDEYKIQNHEITLSEPGFVTVMQEMFGDKSQCHASIDSIELEKSGFLYELNYYADEEISVASKLFQCKVKDEWLVGKKIKDSLEDYRSFVLLSDKNQKSDYFDVTI